MYCYESKQTQRVFEMVIRIVHNDNPATKIIPSFDECVAGPVGWQIAPVELVHLHLVTDERILTDFAAARRARW